MGVVASCGQQPVPAAPTPLPTEVVTPTPTVTFQDNSESNLPDPSSIPEAAAPRGLGGVTLPIRAISIRTRFGDLQWSLSNRNRTPQFDVSTPGNIQASYGKTQPLGCATVGLTARNISTGELYPRGWTAERVILTFTMASDRDVEDFGREGRLFWVTWKTTCSSADSSLSDTLFMMNWGNADSPWLFSALASDPETREELIDAFVTAFSLGD